ncbi:transketolase [Algihabitans albus]|uniref:transketolase n=1 Tax=Algihabitans albus TaxID=2164067 RepID=UPI00228760AF|nr:transketolase [Algihabitans albus]
MAETRHDFDPTTHGTSLTEMANAIRALSMDAVQKANSGHPGMPMGMADVATVLFSQFLRFDPQRPDWPDRDRFVLSAGHGSMLLYSLLHLTGYEDMPIEELANFRQLGSRTAGHPEYGHAAGIETTTGPLGQGLGNAVGMALAERLLAARFGEALVEHHTYCLVGDGCLMEGISHEAISLAGHLKLNKLIVLFDDNAISIDGGTDLSCSDDQLVRFQASGWDTQRVDGHDPVAVAAAIAAAQASDAPSLIACKTVIGFGAPNKQGTAATHGSPLGDAEIAAARKELGWNAAPFVVPDAILAAWRAVGAQGAGLSAAWDARLADAAPADQAELKRRLTGDPPDGLEQAIVTFKQEIVAEAPSVATRVASQKVLSALTGVLPELTGGSADLTGSNGTRAAGMQVVTRDDFTGSYIHYGVREHGMAAAMNGMALHGGILPYGGTFLVFSDYCRPSIRLAALMQQRVVFVMTHDSIGLGEDGPTHQPVEHLAALRAIPGLKVFRPADAVETAECWELALRSNGPSVLALTRQNLPTVRGEHAAENYCSWGAYILASAASQRQVTLLASGSEVQVALEARQKLQDEGISAAVVSMPSWEVFLEQPAHYRDEVLGPGALQIAVEAASPFGWNRWVGLDGTVVGMPGFGASGKAEDLYEHFGITAEGVVKAVKAWL